jgi:aryl-alcohol dehydrogenase-like predicted oxidoreductase
MERRRLGQSGPSISVIAYGLMGLSHTYGRSEDPESLETVHAAIDSGIRPNRVPVIARLRPVRP